MPDVKLQELQESELSIEPPCEHPQHGTDSPWHADGNPHYIRFVAPCGHYGNGIKVACGWWVGTIQGCYCEPCNFVYPAEEVLVDLGPVSSFA